MLTAQSTLYGEWSTPCVTASVVLFYVNDVNEKSTLLEITFTRQTITEQQGQTNLAKSELKQIQSPDGSIISASLYLHDVMALYEFY